MLTLSQQDFTRLVQFVKKNYGIDLSKKMQLIMGRLSNTIISMGYTSFTDYIDQITSSRNPADLEVMLNKLTTNYTYFMREEAHFNFFRETLGAQAALWDTRVLATDISQNALRAAKEAVYDEDSLKNLSPAWVSKYFVKTAEKGIYTVAPSIKSNVIFQTFNLMDPIRFRLKFDVIFCRNVMIYFDQSTKDALIQRFYDATAPGGYLLIGHSETINKEKTPYKYLMPATYRKE